MRTLTKLLSSFVGRLKPDRATARSLALVELPQPTREGGLPLLQALSKRQSSRDFATTQLPLQVLSDLLWAAFGVNRPETGGRTAPSALNAQEIDLYAVHAGGVHLYEPKAHALRLVADTDARRVTGYQDFVDEAPLDLILVADHAHVEVVPAEHRLVFSAASAGAIAQNVYLYAASAGLATVVRAWFDRDAIKAALRLSADEHVLLAQTVGYPAAASNGR
jgi:SagB-type dehydrogenase family enzyme